MAILVIAEHAQGELLPATLSTLTAAFSIADKMAQTASEETEQQESDVELLLTGTSLEPLAKQAQKIVGLRNVLLAEDERYNHFLAEDLATLIQTIGANYSHILAPATTRGKNYLPRAAALLGVEQISEVMVIETPDTFKRPIYAGNAIATVQSFAPIKVLTIRATSFKPAEIGESSAPLETLSLPPKNTDNPLSIFLRQEKEVTERPSLTEAEIVVSGGRGVHDKESFELIFQLADKLGAAVGASRAAVDSGFVPNDYQVGQTGKIIAPQLYFAIGISGAIQHLAGIKEAKTIVAINKDEEAPIFQVATYGLVGDLFTIIPELIEKL